MTRHAKGASRMCENRSKRQKWHQHINSDLLTAAPGAEGGDGDKAGEVDDDGDEQEDAGDDGRHQRGQVEVHPVPGVDKPPDPLLHGAQGGLHLVGHDLVKMKFLTFLSLLTRLIFTFLLDCRLGINATCLCPGLMRDYDD